MLSCSYYEHLRNCSSRRKVHRTRMVSLRISFALDASVLTFQCEASSMALLKLPTELLLEIASYIDGERDLNAFVCTHPRFYQLLNHELYRRTVEKDALTFIEQIKKGRIRL